MDWTTEEKIRLIKLMMKNKVKEGDSWKEVKKNET